MPALLLLSPLAMPLLLTAATNNHRHTSTGMPFSLLDHGESTGWLVYICLAALAHYKGFCDL